MTRPTTIVTRCAGCGIELNDFQPRWSESVNLTPDALFVADEAVVEVGDRFLEMDVAFDWCSVRCFARWLYRACALLGTPPRYSLSPDEMEADR